MFWCAKAEGVRVGGCSLIPAQHPPPMWDAAWITTLALGETQAESDGKEQRWTEMDLEQGKPALWKLYILNPPASAGNAV